MKNKFKIIINQTILLISVYSSIAYCESPYCSITGIILDKDTHKPVSSANVYLAYTLTGSSTNKFGYYSIEKINPGRYFLVVSHVGYEDKHVQITIKKGEKINYNFQLVPKIYQMKPIIVLSDSTEWEKNLKRFLKEFLGTSKSSKITSINNTEVLDFNLAGSTLLASALFPLEIINRSLGYKIEYSLYHFESTYDYVKYTGFPKFIELESAQPEILEIWKINRRNTYEGSLRHFLNVICLNYDFTTGKTGSIEFEIDYSDRTSRGYKQKYKDDNFLIKNGFEVLHRKSMIKSRMALEMIARLVNTNDYLKPADNENEMYFKFENYLEVRYTSPDNIRNLFKTEEQISWITLEKDSIVIDKSGRYYETFSIKTSGFWGLERISDILPYEYVYNDSSVLYNRE